MGEHQYTCLILPEPAVDEVRFSGLSIAWQTLENLISAENVQQVQKEWLSATGASYRESRLKKQNLNNECRCSNYLDVTLPA